MIVINLQERLHVTNLYLFHEGDHLRVTQATFDAFQHIRDQFVYNNSAANGIYLFLFSFMLYHPLNLFPSSLPRSLYFDLFYSDKCWYLDVWHGVGERCILSIRCWYAALFAFIFSIYIFIIYLFLFLIFIFYMLLSFLIF